MRLLQHFTTILYYHIIVDIYIYFSYYLHWQSNILRKSGTSTVKGTGFCLCTVRVCDVVVSCFPPPLSSLCFRLYHPIPSVASSGCRTVHTTDGTKSSESRKRKTTDGNTPHNLLEPPSPQTLTRRSMTMMDTVHFLFTCDCEVGWWAWAWLGNGTT